jgi:hypothetical protein
MQQQSLAQYMLVYFGDTNLVDMLNFKWTNIEFSMSNSMYNHITNKWSSRSFKYLQLETSNCQGVKKKKLDKGCDL